MTGPRKPSRVEVQRAGALFAGCLVTLLADVTLLPPLALAVILGWEALP